MTPTADLMKLVEEIRQWAVEGCYNDADDGEAPLLMVHQTQQSYLAIADRIAAALSAMGEARVGGEVTDAMVRQALHFCPDSVQGQPARWRWIADSINRQLRGIHAATPAQPKASEACKFCQRTEGCGEMDMGHKPRCLRDHPKASEGEAGGEDARDAARYRWLRDSEACALHIEHNDHHTVYESAEAKIRWQENDPKADYFGHVSEDEKRRMIEADSIWTLHIYPNTPIGFNVYHAATLDAAIDAAMTATLTAPGADDEKR